MRYTIWEQRTAQGLTLRQLEEKSGVSKTQINLIENGKGNPTMDTLERIAAGLGLSVTDLIQV